jgi:hypothetical protein
VSGPGGFFQSAPVIIAATMSFRGRGRFTWWDIGDQKQRRRPRRTAGLVLR